MAAAVYFDRRMSDDERRQALRRLDEEARQLEGTGSGPALVALMGDERDR